LEGAIDPAVAKVADLEIDESVLALLVDRVVGSHGLAGEQGGAQGQCGEGLLQHGKCSLMKYQYLARPNMRRRVSSRSMKWCLNAARACNAARITSAQAA